MDDDLKLLETAKQKARENLEKEPSKANLEAFNTASKMLAEYMAGSKEPAFDNRVAAHKYLKRLGYKIGKSKFYQDCKNGLCRVQSDGSVLESDIKAYISKAGLVKPNQAAYEIESSELTRKRQKREVEKLTAQVEKLDFENKILRKEYMRRDQVETEQAIKAGALMAGLTHTYRIFARDAIQMVEGNLKHTQALVNFWTAKAEDLFNEFARMEEIQVKLKN
jgi:hypothetical protein